MSAPLSRYVVPADVLAQVLKNPRLIRTFQALGENLTATEDATTGVVADTAALKDAAFVTLSANAELPNERVLRFGPGIAGDVGSSSLTLKLDRNVPQVSGGFSATFVAAGDSQLGLPLAGTLATQEWVNAQGFGAGGGTSGGSFDLDDNTGSFDLDDG